MRLPRFRLPKRSTTGLRPLAWACGLGLAVVGALACAGWVETMRALDDQRGFTSLVRTASDQKQLCDRTWLFTHRFAKDQASSLKRSLEDWQDNESVLSKSLAEGGERDSTAFEMLTTALKSGEQVRRVAQIVLAGVKQASAAQERYGLAGQQRYKVEIDNLVRWLAHESNRRSAHVAWVAAAVLTAIVLTLILEAMFLYLPVIRKLESSLQQREAHKEALEINNADLTELQGQLTQTNESLAHSERHAKAALKTAEQAVKLQAVAANRFMDLFDAVPSAVFTIDRDKTIREWNKTAEKIFGLDAFEVVDRNLIERLGRQENSRELRQISEAVIRGETVTGVNWTFTRGDDTKRNLLCSAFPLHGPDGAVVGGVCANVDVTQIKETEEALRQSEERIRAIFEGSPIGIFMADSEAKIVYSNPTWHELTGLSGEAAVGAKWLETIHPDDRIRVFREWKRRSVECDEFLCEYRTVRGDDETIWIRARAGEARIGSKMYGYIGTLEDITDRKLMETAAIESEARFRTALEAMQNGVMVVRADRTIEVINPKAVEILGLQGYEVVGQSLDARPYHVFTEEHEEIDKDHLPVSRALQGDWVGGVTLAIVRPDETTVLIKANCTPLYRNSSKTPSAAVASFVDVTVERNQNKRIEEDSAEIQRMNVQLEQRQRELQEANEKLEALAAIDGLTQIHNRRSFQQQLRAGIDRQKESGKPLSLVLLDVDHFKKYNDSHGHLAGDDVLIQVAKLLQASAFAGDFVARFGGEEFAVLLPATDARAATLAAERLRIAIDRHEWPIAGVTASFGVSTSLGELTEETLIDRADRALYAAKDAGRNRSLHSDQLTGPDRRSA